MAVNRSDDELRDLQVRHQLGQGDGLLPDGWIVCVAMNDVASSKAHESGEYVHWVSLMKVSKRS